MAAKKHKPNLWKGRIIRLVFLVVLVAFTYHYSQSKADLARSTSEASLLVAIETAFREIGEIS